MASNSGDPEATSPGSTTDEVQATVPDMDKIMAGGSVGENESGGQQKVVAKLLVSNSAAGSVIGKNGVSIDQLQRSSKARIQLSRAGEFYPGTSDRVLMLSGPLHNVLTALYLILEKVASDNTHRLQSDNNTEQIKVALPRRLCGVVIGQQGTTVRNFMNDSGATIRVQSLNDLSREDSERIVTIYGSRDKVLRAAALVLNALSMDPKYAGYLETTLQLAQSQGLVGPVKTTVGKSPLFGARTTIIVAIPDEDVGAILGKGGQTLARLQQAAKVKISVSDRKMMDPKSREREVTIVGTHPQVKHAEAMIAEKISQHRAQRAAAEDDEEYTEEHH